MARRIFVTLGTVYIVWQAVYLVSDWSIDRDSVPGWAVALLLAFVLTWFGSGLVVLASALRRRRLAA